MRHRTLAFLGIPVLLVFLIVGLVRLADAQSPSPTPTPAQGDPYAGLPEAERQQRVQEAMARTQARERAFREDFIRSRRDFRNLRQVPYEARHVPAKPDLATAVAQADIIVVGTAKALQFRVEGGADVTIAVSQTIKGPDSNELVIRQSTTPMPSKDGGPGILYYSEADPPITPDTRVILLVRRSDSGSHFVQGFTGQYIVVANRVIALKNNPFRTEVDGLTEKAMIDRLTRLATP